MMIKTQKNQSEKIKREGNQHGLVSTFGTLPYWNHQLNPRRMIKLPVAFGIWIKVSQKLTNHSKCCHCRSSCNGCHIRPVSKAKDKTKGTYKLKSSDVVTNYRLVDWRAVDPNPRFNFSGVSATGILENLDDYEDPMYDDDYYDIYST